MKSFLFSALLVFFLLGCEDSGNIDLDSILKKRPSMDKVIFDYVGIMDDVGESTQRYLERIRNHYGMEILIVAMPSLENRYTISEAAAEMFTNWRTGKAYNGRGILMIFVDDIKKVRLEVGYELEDVFTDAFTGYIQDIQLQPRYTANQLDIGFIAVMEEIESRAQIKFQGNYTPESVAGLDADYLSQGAGAERNLKSYHGRFAGRDKTVSGKINTAYPAGKTPEEAWKTMIRVWKNKMKDPYLGVYTSITRLTYRDFINMPDSQLDKQYQSYVSKNYEVLQEGDYAVIYFGKKSGWDNSPFLLCRTNEGWQFDIVHQRRFIRMGNAPHWGVEFSEHPHMNLLLGAFHFQGQDIPMEDNDGYTIERDTKIADLIIEFEDRLKNEPDSADLLLELGRLYTICAMNQKGISLLKQALKLNPDNPIPLKYLAIAYVDAYYQYDTAQTHLAAYIKTVPDDPWGYNFSGYIHYRKKEYNAAEKAFQNAISLNPENCYAHFYLTYTYARLYSETSKLNPAKKTYQERFAYHREKTQSFEAKHPLRVLWLNRL
jgi:lipoprotein NlpI